MRTVFAMTFLALVASPVAASEPVPITASVPLSCRVAADPLSLTAPGEWTGNVSERCNGGSGFRVVALHRALQSGEVATINYDGQQFALDGDGRSVLIVRAPLRIADVPVAVRSDRTDASLDVRFTLELL